MSWVVWIAGVAGDAGHALAAELSRALGARDHAAVVLDTACMRRLLSPGTPDADDGPDVVDRAVVHVAWLLADAGIPTILHGPLRPAARDLARTALPHFVDVRVTATAGEPADLVVDLRDDPRGAATAVLDAIGTLCPGVRPRPKAEAPAWAIWITGMPGTGKTTLAWAAADVLAARGVPITVVDWGRLASFATPGGPHSPHEADVLRRAILAAVVLLTDAGIAVLVDATTPERAWREVARERIARFAEVQLLCPATVAADRERAVRWRLVPCVHGRRASDVMEVIVGYESARAPELTLQTDVVDVATATAEIVHLAERLARRAAGPITPSPRSTPCASNT